MVFGTALGVYATIQNGARVNTFTVVTRLVGATVNVGAAALDTPDTLADLVRVTVLVIATNVLAKVAKTQLVSRTVTVLSADRFAKATVTLEIIPGTLVGGGTLGWCPDTTDHGRRALDKSSGTNAKSTLINNLALGIGTTNSALARINTPVGKAGQ